MVVPMKPRVPRVLAGFRDVCVRLEVDRGGPHRAVRATDGPFGDSLQADPLPPVQTFVGQKPDPDPEPPVVHPQNQFVDFVNERDV